MDTTASTAPAPAIKAKGDKLKLGGSSGTGDTFRVSSATGPGSFAPDDCTGASINETMRFVESRPGVRLSPAATPDEYGCEVVVEYALAATPPAKTAAANTVVINLLDMSAPGGGNAVTASIASCLVGEYSLDAKTKPHSHRQKFHYSAGPTENLNPITFS